MRLLHVDNCTADIYATPPPIVSEDDENCNSSYNQEEEEEDEEDDDENDQEEVSNNNKHDKTDNNNDETKVVITDDIGWIYLPFVSEDSIWGKNDEETSLRVKMWLPSASDIIQKIESFYDSNKNISSINLIYKEESIGCYLEYEEEVIDINDNLIEMNIS